MAALAELGRRRPDAVFVVADSLTAMNRKPIIEFLTTQRIPAMYEVASFVNDGGLMTSIEMVELNPVMDIANRTAILAVELLMSALGKRIL